jgi:NDP-sugar pyrophosphorylase family protein
LKIEDFILDFPLRGYKEQQPWEITMYLSSIIEEILPTLNEDFIKTEYGAIHKSARVEQGATLKYPIIISENCFVGANAYLRGGVYLGKSVVIGLGCEIKSSIISSESAISHFNFIGDSIIGSNVNFEAGSVIANHFNERTNKKIVVRYKSEKIDTGVHKFGAMVGDYSKIGANAVLSPGTILPANSIVKRLELVDQNPDE